MTTISEMVIKTQISLDRFWSAVWLLALLRWWQERKLAAVLEETGEQSVATRRATERFRLLERSMKFWRTSPPLILDALEASRRAGVPVSDLQLIALNRDIRVVGNSVTVRRQWWSDGLAFVVVVALWASWARLVVLIADSSVPLLGRVAGVLLLTLFYWGWSRGVTLYSTRANAAVKRSGAAVEAVAMSVRRTSSIIYLND
ncbi:hypothetical protein [Aquabacterium sp.]|uniref:hypothetical protein n=1 Tax=Aquabacterium sp. TaxID=1872578 RepID=UPI0035B0B52F